MTKIINLDDIDIDTARTELVARPGNSFYRNALDEVILARILDFPGGAIRVSPRLIVVNSTGGTDVSAENLAAVCAFEFIAGGVKHVFSGIEIEGYSIPYQGDESHQIIFNFEPPKV